MQGTNCTEFARISPILRRPPATGRGLRRSAGSPLFIRFARRYRCGTKAGCRECGAPLSPLRADARSVGLTAVFAAADKPRAPATFRRERGRGAGSFDTRARGGGRLWSLAVRRPPRTQAPGRLTLRRSAVIAGLGIGYVPGAGVARNTAGVARNTLIIVSPTALVESAQRPPLKYRAAAAHCPRDSGRCRSGCGEGCLKGKRVGDGLLRG